MGVDSLHRVWVAVGVQAGLRGSLPEYVLFISPSYCLLGVSATRACVRAGKRALLAIARALVQRSDQCNPQEVSNSGEQACRHQQLGACVGQHCMEQPCSPAFALLPALCSTFFLSSPSLPSLPSPLTQLLPTLPALSACLPCLPAVWAFAKLGHYDGPLMTTMAAEATRRIDEFRCHAPTSCLPLLATLTQSPAIAPTGSMYCAQHSLPISTCPAPLKASPCPCIACPPAAPLGPAPLP